LFLLLWKDTTILYKYDIDIQNIHLKKILLINIYEGGDEKVIIIFENYTGFMIKNHFIYFGGKDIMYKNRIFFRHKFWHKTKMNSMIYNDVYILRASKGRKYLDESTTDSVPVIIKIKKKI